MARLGLFESALSRKLLLAAGASASLAVACGDDSSTGSGGAGGSGGDTTTSSTGATGTATSTATGQTSTATGSTSSSTGATGSSNASTSTGGGAAERCFFPTGDPIGCPSLEMAPQYYSCTDQLEFVTSWISGPVLENKMCCYQVEITEPNDPNCGIIGRPLMVDGAAARAGVRSGKASWARGNQPNTENLSDAERDQLARAWAFDATYEHASVASFSKLSLELMALGAPADLVRLAHEAALDEIRHAELGFLLASSYAGVSLSPGPLAEATRLEFNHDLATLAAAAVREGCVGETLAALVASAQHDVATDRSVIAALDEIRVDEGKHAELAWRIVSWAITQGGADVREAVRLAFESSIVEQREAPLASDLAMHAHGRLSGEEMKAVRLRGTDDIILPAMSALLG